MRVERTLSRGSCGRAPSVEVSKASLQQCIIHSPALIPFTCTALRTRLECLVDAFERGVLRVAQRIGTLRQLHLARCWRGLAWSGESAVLLRWHYHKKEWTNQSNDCIRSQLMILLSKFHSSRKLGDTRPGSSPLRFCAAAVSGSSLRNIHQSIDCRCFRSPPHVSPGYGPCHMQS